MSDRPPRYAIGDPQGCCEALRALVQRLPSPGRLWLAGDLVNRGPQSLATLRYVRGLGARALTVLGNHDLHLLAVAAGARRPKRGDTIDDVLGADPQEGWIDWVRAQPLARYEDGCLLVHAGVAAQWTAEQTVALAAEVEAVLRGDDWGDFMRMMYGDEPAAWDDALTGDDRLRAIVNHLTRARFIDAGGRLDFRNKGEPDPPPDGLLPWFDAPGRRTAGTTVVFGHWSALGLLLRDDLVGLDTGCVWGRSLTAVRLEDREVFQVPCPRAQDRDGD